MFSALASRWSSDTSQRSIEELQALNTRTSSGTISESALALPRASPDKSRLKERIRYCSDSRASPFAPSVDLATMLHAQLLWVQQDGFPRVHLPSQPAVCKSELLRSLILCSATQCNSTQEKSCSHAISPSLGVQDAQVFIEAI